MTSSERSEPGEAHEPKQLLETPQLADALENDRFKRFLDHIPFAVAVAELHPSEHVTYANIEFERLTGKSAADVEGASWECLSHCVALEEGGVALSNAVIEHED